MAFKNPNFLPRLGASLGTAAGIIAAFKLAATAIGAKGGLLAVGAIMAGGWAIPVLIGLAGVGGLIAAATLLGPKMMGTKVTTPGVHWRTLLASAVTLGSLPFLPLLPAGAVLAVSAVGIYSAMRGGRIIGVSIDQLSRPSGPR